MAVVRNPDKEYSYVLSCDRGLAKEKQTVFYYKPAGLEEQYGVLDNNVVMERQSSGEMITKMSINKEGEISMLLNCITRIDNLNDEDGKGLSWNQNGVVNATEHRKKILAVLDGAWRAELAEVIRTGSALDEGDTKN